MGDNRRRVRPRVSLSHRIILTQNHKKRKRKSSNTKLNRLEKKCGSKRRELPKQQSFCTNCSLFIWATMCIPTATQIPGKFTQIRLIDGTGVRGRSQLWFRPPGSHQPGASSPGYGSQLLFIRSVSQTIQHKVKPVLLLFTGKVFRFQFFFSSG